MKYVVIVLSLIAFDTFAVGFTGCWSSSNNTSSYVIKLAEKGKDVRGSYCFINSNGNKTDCDKNLSIIEGVISNNRLSVTFGGAGKGLITKNNNAIMLSMVDKKPFDDFNMHIPDKLNLNQTKNCNIPN
ncbi:hypothetical protein [Pseudescherichia sp.]|uniref:hypothetical protein n=1 Tax=Pseudescherichia sp. TaxID=2055881 RepID=UPI002899B7E1|nr:hypothetical protein [Pseudescherichia sp.]